jgi:hypothetical protein
MQATPIDREDLARPADDGCSALPERTGDTTTHDLAELWRDVGGSD